MSLLHRIPASWKLVLERLQQNGHPEAFIGGGALRDLDNNRPIKDIDVFLRRVNAAELSSLFPGMAITDETAHDTQYAAHFNDVLDGVFEGTMNDGSPPFNFISCVGPNREPGLFMGFHRNRFDLGLCQISFNGRGLIRSGAYRRDVSNRTITLMRETGRERSLERARHIRDRVYREWSIIDPFVHLAEVVPAAIAPGEFVWTLPPESVQLQNDRDGMEAEDL